MIIRSCILHPKYEQQQNPFIRPYSARVRDEIFKQKYCDRNKRVQSASTGRRSTIVPQIKEVSLNLPQIEEVSPKIEEVSLNLSTNVISFVSKLKVKARETRFIKRTALMSFYNNGYMQFRSHWSTVKKNGCYESTKIVIIQACYGLEDIYNQVCTILRGCYGTLPLVRVLYIPTDVESNVTCEGGCVLIIAYMHADTVIVTGDKNVRNALVFSFCLDDSDKN